MYRQLKKNIFIIKLTVLNLKEKTSVFRSNWFPRTPRDMIFLQNAQQVMFMKYQLKDVNNYANLLKSMSGRTRFIWP